MVPQIALPHSIHDADDYVAGRLATASRRCGIEAAQGGPKGFRMAAPTMSAASANTTPMRPRGRSETGLSIVVPVFNEGAGLAALHARIAEIAGRLKERWRLTTEVVYIDDGSRDDTLAIARGLPADVLDVQVVSLSRNFGKEAALLAG